MPASGIVIVRVATRPAGAAPADRTLEDVIVNGAGPTRTSGVSYAGLVTRAIAIVIDALLINAAALAVTGAVLLVQSVFAVSHRHHGLANAIGVVLFFAWVVGYFSVFWTTTGQTPGSRVMQIQVTRADGTGLRPRHALARLAGMVVSLPLFWGYLPILWSPRRRGAYDVVAGTVVTVVPSVAGMDQRGSARVSHSHARGIEPPSTVP
jgi:uncharacterized RDD family membrane protein YckC